MSDDGKRVALVTGGARRIGAAIVKRLHQDQYRVVVHYHRSVAAAAALVDELELARSGSAVALAADLLDAVAVADLAERALERWGRLDLLVNNASVFRPSPLGQIEPELWDELMGSNLRAPFQLVGALAPALRAAQGAVVNIVDVHADQPLAEHSVYSAAKAGLAMLTRSAARDLAPDVRVNAVAPGAILWPEDDSRPSTDDPEHLAVEANRAALLARLPVGRQGTPLEVADAVLFLAGASYVTGQVLRVDGGRHMV